MTARAHGVLVTRAEPGAQETAARLRDMGFAPVLAPMLRVQGLLEHAPDMAGAQAVLLTSANGARAWSRAGGALSRAVCVGEGTADAARAVGFQQILAADGDAESLAVLVRAELSPAGGALIWPGGEDIARDLGAMLAPAGFKVRRIVAYRAIMADALPDEARAALAGGGLSFALFHSARAARALGVVLRRDGLDAAARDMTAICISDRVAAAAGDLTWARVVAADAPTERGVLAALTATAGRA